MLLISLLAALGVFFGVAGVGRYVVDHSYMSPASVSSRRAEIYAAFAAFVKAEGIRGDEPGRIEGWDAYGDYVNIQLYRPPAGDEGRSLTEQSAAGQPGKLYPLQFQDGLYHIAIQDNTRARELMLNNLAALAAASVVFFLVMLSYIRLLTVRIVRLSEEALTVSQGDLHHPIPCEGEDELSMLAGEMDAMRCAVIERMGNEQRAWEANSELITAISHDIRTPMTALIGYLGLLNSSDFADPEKSRAFALSAQNKAMELKDLTDELFRYFLVFGSAGLELNKERLDGGMLLQQLLAEAEFELSEQGFRVQNIGFAENCEMEADPLYLKRVMDNLVSNIRKYADPDSPVVFLTEQKEGLLTVCVSNTVKQKLHRTESTKIGLRTCIKILEQMGGSFQTRHDGEHFAAEFALPLV